MSPTPSDSLTDRDPKDSQQKHPLYEASTQFRNWRYSPEGLAQIRATLNEAAVAAIRSTFEADKQGSSANVAFLDANEEVLLVKLYITKISQLCAMFRFPEEVEATAVSYLKRFYLKNTVMDWHPKNVMLTALFLATKTTNNPISLETYTAHIPKTAPSDVLDLEFLVAQSLNFEFTIWHAHRALWGIWLDLQNLQDIPANLPATIYDDALNHIRASRVTDAELIYAPSQIALAAVSLASPELALQWAQSKLLPDAIPSLQLSLDTLPSVIESIKSIILSEGRAPDVEAVREVDRRLRICKNPEKVVGSNAYLVKRADEERKAEQKRSRKVLEMQKGQTDPFGDEIQDSNSNVYDDDDDD